MNQLSAERLRDLVPGYHTNWVRWGIVCMVLAYGIVVGERFVTATNLWVDLGLELAVVLVGVVALALVARGRDGMASALALVAVWSELLSSVYLNGGLAFSGTIVLPLVVLAMGLLRGGTAAFATAVVTSVAAPHAAAMGASRPGGGGAPPTVHEVVVVTLSLLATALLVHLGLKTLRAVLASALRSERQFSDLVNHAPDGILAVDDEGRLVSINPAAARMLGCEERDTRGSTLSELAPEICARLPTCAGEMGGTQEELTTEVIVLHHSSGTVTAEATARAVPLPDGRPGTQIMLRNVSERRSAEELAAQLGGIVENALNEIYVFHAISFRLLRANRGGRENLGYTMDELMALSWADVNPALGPEGMAEILERLGSDGAISLRGVHRRKDGSAYPVETQLQAGTLGGEPVVVAFAVDVSDRERGELEQRDLQAQLQHAQKMEAVGHLAGGVAHDFNNLLTVVGGYAAMLEASGDSEVRELAAEISRAHERGASLTRQLLAFARKEVAQPRVVSLVQVVRDMERILLRMMGERYAVRLESEGEGWITADVGQIEQVVMNLAANARDAMPEGGKLTVSIFEPGEPGPDGREQVALVVSDSGTGMDARTAASIFQPFFTTKPRGKGTGLGLSTVHGIVTQNAGRIEVDTAPGEGTRIRILWPRANPSGRDDGGKGLPDTSSRGHETVLLAEDDEAMRALVVRLLEGAGYRVLPARDGSHAIELSNGVPDRIDLLLTDMVMPGPSGIDVAEHVRARRPGIRVLFMSGYLDDDLHSDARIDPSKDVLLKPFRAPELLSRIRSALHA